MATLLRKTYEVLSSYSTATHTSMCDDLIRQLDHARNCERTLAGHFTRAIEANRELDSRVDVPFIPEGRGAERVGTNRITHVMQMNSPLRLKLEDGTQYEFEYLEREVPHLRAGTAEEQKGKAWIDYVARTNDNPILGEVKWQGDKNPFYAFMQLLVYLSEMATPDQIARATRHHLFGPRTNQLFDHETDAPPAFDLHIFLANFNEEGARGDLIQKTKCLATHFKRRLGDDQTAARMLLGNILCISATVAPESDEFGELQCMWAV